MRSLWRQVFTQKGIILTLTLTASACLPFALSPFAPDAALTLLLPTVLAGIASFFGLTKAGRRRTPALAVWILLGPALLFIRLGGLAGALFDGTRSTLALVAVVLQPERDLGQLQQVAAWLNSQGQMWDQVIAFGERAILWLAALLHAGVAQDLAARALWLGLGMWLLAGWTAWRIRIKDDPLGGLLPTSVLIAIAVNSSSQDRWPLWLHVASLLALLALMHISRLTSAWEVKRIDFSDSIPEDITVNSIVLVIGLLLVAYSVSVFSLKDIIDRLRERQQPAASSVASAPGKGPDSGRISSGALNGLQASHVISAGPRLSHELVMSISTGDLPPVQYARAVEAPRYYWRGATYQEYLGRGWTNATMTIDEAPPGADLLPAGTAGDAREVRGVVTVPNGGVGVVYWAGALDRMDIPLEVMWRNAPEAVPTASLPAALGNGDMIGAEASGQDPTPVKSYHFVSAVSQASEDELRAAPLYYPAWVTARYLQLPSSLPERVRALARDLTVHSRTPYDRALAIETYLRGIPYTLDVPAPPHDRDAADFFLFDLKRGYCDYYATTMAVLARASGLPARLVIGFDSGSYDPYTAQYIITEADAHAWVEIYFTGIGWVEFEPTADQPAPKRETAARPVATPKAQPPKDDTESAVPGFDLGNLRWLAWSIPLGLAVLLAWLTFDSLRLFQLEPADGTRRVYRRMRRWTRLFHASAGPHETASEYARAFTTRLDTLSEKRRLPEAAWKPAATAVNELTGIYTESLFGPSALSRLKGRKAIQLWISARWRILLLTLILAITRRFPDRQGAPSSHPDSQAG